VAVIYLQQRPRDSVANRTSLASNTPTRHRCDDVERANRVRDPQWPADRELEQWTRIALLERLAVDDDVADARLQNDAGNTCFAPPDR
jgi:hypothetical protein